MERRGEERRGEERRGEERKEERRIVCGFCNQEKPHCDETKRRREGGLRGKSTEQT
jgi:hypothetical protein